MRTVITTFCLLAGAVVVTADAQGICIREALSVNIVSGRVISKLDNGETPLPRSTVFLRQDRYQGRVVAQTTSDSDGNFWFDKKIKQGKYIFEVTYPNLAAFNGRLNLIVSNTKRPQKEIIVTMGADFTKPCGGSSAELRIKKPV